MYCVDNLGNWAFNWKRNVMLSHKREYKLSPERTKKKKKGFKKVKKFYPIFFKTNISNKEKKKLIGSCYHCSSQQINQDGAKSDYCLEQLDHKVNNTKARKCKVSSCAEVSWWKIQRSIQKIKKMDSASRQLSIVTFYHRTFIGSKVDTFISWVSIKDKLVYNKEPVAHQLD